MSKDVAERIVLALTSSPSILPENASDELKADLDSISAGYLANKAMGFDFRTAAHMAKTEFIQKICDN